MILANVNIGTGPSAGDGDPLRSAFNTINQNFAKIQSNVNSLTNSVTSVAGRTGNISLTTQDIIGITNYANISYVSSAITNGNVAFTMSNLQHWTSNVTTVSAALNQLAARIWAIENP